jgi:hypothetical protein
MTFGPDHLKSYWSFLRAIMIILRTRSSQIFMSLRQGLLVVLTAFPVKLSGFVNRSLPRNRFFFLITELALMLILFL